MILENPMSERPPMTTAELIEWQAKQIVRASEALRRWGNATTISRAFILVMEDGSKLMDTSGFPVLFASADQAREFASHLKYVWEPNPVEIIAHLKEPTGEERSPK